MKKLMIAAAAAAMVGGTFAANCEIPETPDAPAVGTAWVYTWKFTGKTTVGYLTKGSVIPGDKGSNCNIPGTDTKVAGCVVRIPGTLKIQGYTYTCDPECAYDYNQFKTIDGASPKEGYFNWKMTKPFADKQVVGTLAMNVGNVIGKKATQFETQGEATFETSDPAEKFTLNFAGLGTYNLKYRRVTSVSGYFAGTYETPQYIKNHVCKKAIVWNCAAAAADAEGSAFIDDDVSVAYGKWSAKYNSKASKNYYVKGTLLKL